MNTLRTTTPRTLLLLLAAACLLAAPAAACKDKACAHNHAEADDAHDHAAHDSDHAAHDSDHATHDHDSHDHAAHDSDHAAHDSHAAHGHAAATAYGAGAGEGEIVAIADILDDAAAWEGREVRVAGEITGVCVMAGCWIEIEDEGGSLRLKVNDGDIVFPTEIEGHQAVARGVVERQELDRERYVGWKQHLAEELGEEFDPASVGDGPYVIVQLRGLGAEVEG